MPSGICAIANNIIDDSDMYGNKLNPIIPDAASID